MSQAPVAQTPFGYTVRIEPDGSVVSESSSPGLAALIGRSPEEIAARGGWQAFIHPEDLSDATGAIDVLLTGETWEGDLRVMTASGEYRLLHLYSEAEALEDGGVRVEGWGHDATDTVSLVTRLQQLEERLRLLLDHVSAITWTTDTNMRFTSYEGAVLSDFGLRGGEVVGMAVDEFLSEDEVREQGVAATKQALGGETVTYQTPWRGEEFGVIIEPLSDFDGNVIGTLGVAVLMRNYVERREHVRSLRSELQQARMSAVGIGSGEVITLGKLVINPVAFAVWKDGERVPLSPTEFRLLLEFVRRRDEALSRETLLQDVWKHDFMGESRLVDMAVKRLRDKIEDDPAEPSLIRTVRGVGYRLETPESGAA